MAVSDRPSPLSRENLLATARLLVALVLAGLAAHCQRTLSVSPIPGIPTSVAPDGLWALALAAAVGVGVGVLGFCGHGARAVAAMVRHRMAYGYVLPAAAGMLLLVFIPFGYGLGLGFYNHDHGTYTFVGLDNFKEILTGGGYDPVTQTAELKVCPVRITKI